MAMLRAKRTPLLVWMWSFMLVVSKGARRNEGQCDQGDTCEIIQRVYLGTIVKGIAEQLLASTVVARARARYYQEEEKKPPDTLPVFMVDINFKNRSKVVRKQQRFDHLTQNSQTAIPLCCRNKKGIIEAFIPQDSSRTSHAVAKSRCEKESATICSLPSIRNYFNGRQWDSLVAEDMRSQESKSYWVQDVMPPLSEIDGQIAEYMRYILVSWRRMALSTLGVCAWNVVKHFYSGQGDLRLIEELLKQKTLFGREKLRGYDMLDINYQYLARSVENALTELHSVNLAEFSRISRSASISNDQERHELLMEVAAGKPKTTFSDPNLAQLVENEPHPYYASMVAGIARDVVFSKWDIFKQRPLGTFLATTLFNANFLPFVLGKIVAPVFFAAFKGAEILSNLAHLKDWIEHIHWWVENLEHLMVIEEIGSMVIHGLTPVLAPGALQSPVLRALLAKQLHDLHHFIGYRMFLSFSYERRFEMFKVYKGWAQYGACDLPDAMNVKKDGATLMFPSDFCGVFVNMAREQMCQVGGIPSDRLMSSIYDAAYAVRTVLKRNKTITKFANETFESLTGRCAPKDTTWACKEGVECTNPGYFQSELVQRSQSAILRDFVDDLEKIAETYIYGSEYLGADGKEAQKTDSADNKKKQPLSAWVLATYNSAKLNFVTRTILPALVYPEIADGVHESAEQALSLIWYTGLVFAKETKDRFFKQTVNFSSIDSFSSFTTWVSEKKNRLKLPDRNIYMLKTDLIMTALHEARVLVDDKTGVKEEELLAAILGEKIASYESLLRFLFNQAAKLMIRLLVKAPIDSTMNIERYVELLNKNIRKKSKHMSSCTFSPGVQHAFIMDDYFDALKVSSRNTYIFGGAHFNFYFDGFPDNHLYAQLEVQCTRSDFEGNHQLICFRQGDLNKEYLQFYANGARYLVQWTNDEALATEWFITCDEQ
eukprot:TRINITY_DN14883_c0_g1_i1.p1 TRINITY_DN14883_c0_g1~~TRINITY_DN14883_c0_g1_i1.p1  ORF type:complete len:942 (+),score=94.84 TRINITY_DN14883_c0_g1_i1:13-2838(+)